MCVCVCIGVYILARTTLELQSSLNLVFARTVLVQV